MGIPKDFGDRSKQSQQLPFEAKITQRKSPKRDRPQSEDQAALPADTKAADVVQKKLSTHSETPDVPQSSTPKISKSEKQAAARTQRLAARSLDKTQGQKRERPEAEESVSGKKAHGSTAQKSSKLQPSEVFDFPALPIDLQRVITNKLDPRTQQSFRQARKTLNKEVTETIHRYDLGQLVGFTDFLATKLQDASFATPQKAKDAILTSTLENPNEALYIERSRVIDKLITLDSNKLEELAQEYKNPIYHILPPKFENIFKIAKLEKATSEAEEPTYSQELVSLDAYEYFRCLDTYATNEDKIAQVGENASILLGDDLNSNDYKNVLTWDRETLNYMERILSSDPDKTQRDSALAHLAAGIARIYIAKGKPELALQEINKSCVILEQSEPNEDFSMAHLYNYHLDSLTIQICSSTLDEVSVDKIFELFVQSAKRIPDKSESKKILDYIKIIHGSINLVREWATTEQLNQMLQELEKVYPLDILSTIKELLEKRGQSTPEASQEYFKRCITRLEPTQDCYAKTEILISLYQHVDGSAKIVAELTAKSMRQFGQQFDSGW